MIRIVQNQFNGRLEIYVLRYYGLKDPASMEVLNDGDWIRMPEGEPYPKPSIVIPHVDIPELIQELASLGVKTTNDHKIEGKLEATEYHLEDLRQLLKLNQQEVLVKTQ